MSGSNQVAYAASQAVADNLSTYNPLFVWGVGWVDSPRSKLWQVKYLVTTLKSGCFSPGEQFTNELIEAIFEKNTAKFRKNIDILIF